MRSVRVRIRPDGRIEAETIGFVGESCLAVIPDLEDLLVAKTTESHVTEEYFLSAEEQQRPVVRDEDRLWEQP
jgi:hypothetical protein